MKWKRILIHFQLPCLANNGTLGIRCSFQKDCFLQPIYSGDFSSTLDSLLSTQMDRSFFSSLKLVYIFSVNPYLGPLQVSLSRMVMDIMKFFFLYVLVLFAFSCGNFHSHFNQVLSLYSLCKKKQD